MRNSQFSTDLGVHTFRSNPKLLMIASPDFLGWHSGIIFPVANLHHGLHREALVPVMDNTESNTVHDASPAALGFYYQSQFALLTLLSQTADDAAVAIERLDDVELKANGQKLLFQLKHSVQGNPPPVTLASVALWKTIRVWIDALPLVSLAETTFHLVSVGKVPDNSPLLALCDTHADREELLKSMVEEASRVIEDRASAKSAGDKPPHGPRAAGCEAFLALDASVRLSLLRRVHIVQDSVTIGKIPDEVSQRLHILPKEQRLKAAERLLGWWDQQVVYTLCGKRERVIQRSEMEHCISSIIAQLEEEKLVAEFDLVSHPEDYEADGMLYRQIALVGGKGSDVSRAVREQWRAKEQRSKWIIDNPQMRSKIAGYDAKLTEHWSDRHVQMAEDCEDLDADQVRAKGLELLRWTHAFAPNQVEPIAPSWQGHYYVRGTFQVLAIDLQVGWHADYRKLLKD
ncbi:ABC-three component system protein [Pseudomonas syringae]|uniref:ABC-three component system protein n=1 Tax=Pseudomonas syringae TaxID=317 RepID=UPI00211DAED4|nr:ABC-three component system protein [Pseudomonas syringae]